MTSTPLPAPILFGLDRQAFDALNGIRYAYAFDAAREAAETDADLRAADDDLSAACRWRTEFADQVDRRASTVDPLGSPLVVPYAAMVVVHHTGGVEVVARSYWLARDPWWLSTLGEIERVDDGLDIVTYLITGQPVDPETTGRPC